MNLEHGGSSFGPVLVTGLAIIGIALGGAGLYTGATARKAANGQNDRISELEQQVQRLSGASEELNDQIRGLFNRTQTAFQKVDSQLAQLREEGTGTPRPTAQAAAPAAGAEAATATTTASRGGTYTIRSGDLVGKIARSQNTTVDAILKANPGLNPSRLKIGQVINLP